MSSSGPTRDVEALLAEQLAYYRARAPEYSETALPELPTGKLARVRETVIAALDAFRPAGQVLEIACGPGTWTRQLLRHAEALTALDGAQEMLQIAAARVRDERVRFVLADVFEWEPDQRYDVVFFGFWLSHVPLERFEKFWSLIDRCLKPEGRVAFVDDAYRTPDELIEGPESPVVLRRLLNGTSFCAVKVPHVPGELQRRLQVLGWDVTVSSVSDVFFWGSGARASRRRSP